jgi:hypothetical protein
MKARGSRLYGEKFTFVVMKFLLYVSVKIR